MTKQIRKPSVAFYALTICTLIILTLPLFFAATKINVPTQTIVSRLTFLFFFMLGIIFLTKSIRKKSIKIPLSIFLSIILFSLVLLQCLEFYNYFMQGETFNSAFYMSMIDIPLILALLPSQIHFVIAGLVYFSLFVAAFNLLVFFKKIQFYNQRQTITVALCSLSIVVFWTYFGTTAAGEFIKMVCEANEKIEIEEGYAVDKEYYEKLGISVCDVGHDNLTIKSNGIRKNLIFMFLESIETNFLDEELFPGLTPNINRFRNDSHTIFFTEMDQCAGNTSEAMFQTFWGFPSTPAFCTSSSSPEFNDKILNNFCSLPLIFTKAGYTWEHIKAVDLGSFERALSNEGISLDYLHKLKQNKYFNYRDKSLFEYTWNLFQEKEMMGDKNFVISITTLDSHTPNGFVDKNSIEYPNKGLFPQNFGNFKLLDAIHTTDHYLGILIDKILNSETGKNTLIVFMSDHRFMGTADGWLTKKPRKNLFMILNADEGKTISEKGCQLDIAPTILDLFNIQSNYIFPCGISLLKPSTKTYSLRVLDSKRKKELSKYAYSKIQNKSKNQTIAFDEENHKLINIFGTEVPVGTETRGLMSYIILDEDDTVTFINEGIQSQTNENMIKYFENILNAKNKCLFLFQPNKTKKILLEMLYKKIRLDNSNIEAKYAMVYRDKNGRYISVFSNDLNKLSIDLEQYRDISDNFIVKIVETSEPNR